MTAEETHDTLTAGLDEAGYPEQTLDFSTPNEETIRAMKEGRGVHVAVEVVPEVFAKAIGNASDGIPWAGGPDTVDVSTEYSSGDMELTLDGQPVQLAGPARLKTSCPATLWPSDDGGIALHATRTDGIHGLIVSLLPPRLSVTVIDRGTDMPDELRQAILERNALLRLTPPPMDSKSADAAPKLGRPRSTPTKPLPGTLKFAGNAPNTAAVCAMANARVWKEGGESDRFRRFWRQEMNAATVTVGIPHSERAEQIWGCLSKGGAAMVKAHYALWARWYEDADQSGRVRMSINQFCEDLGYKRHHKGGYKLERKQEAMRTLEAMTSTEIVAVCRMKGIDPATGKARVYRLRGRLWERGLVAESMDEYSDLLGTAREGDPSMWEPEGFSYRPGDWFDDSEWRKQNQAVGKIASGILKLRVDTDAWAILVGGYLATMCRANGYKPVRLRASTIMERSGTAPVSADGKRRAGRYEEQFTEAMDKLQEHGVIGGWQWAGGPVEELTDPDDPDTITAYYTDDTRPHDWRSQVAVITWPASMGADAERLEAATAKQITAAKRRAATKRRTKQAMPAVQDVPSEGG